MFTSRFQRTLQILLCLQSGPRYNAAELAQEFRVSRRTIHRDIASLREMGIPIIFDENSGAYCLAPSYRKACLFPTGTDDLASLLLGSHLSLLQTVPTLALTLRKAITKVLSHLPASAQAEMCRLLNICTLGDAVHATTAEHGNILQSILQAIQRKRQIRIAIHGKRVASSLRTKVAPYRLVASTDCWILVGRSSFHRKTYGFDVGTIVEASITEDSYELPRGFRYSSASWELAPTIEKTPDRENKLPRTTVRAAKAIVDRE